MNYPPYEAPPEQHAPLPARASQAVDRSAERVLAAVAHGAIAFGIFGIGLLVSLLISGVIWLYSRRSPHVRFHSEQAGCYQCSVLLINFVLLIVVLFSGGFSILQVFQGREDWGTSWVTLFGVTMGIIWFVGTILYGVTGAVMVLLGKPFKYVIIGDRFSRQDRRTTDTGPGTRTAP
ncbi:MAG: DUF4870 domain-containing protein [Chloroflexia bacterium]